MGDKLRIGFTRVTKTTSFKARVTLCNVYSIHNILNRFFSFGFLGFGYNTSFGIRVLFLVSVEALEVKKTHHILLVVGSCANVNHGKEADFA